MCGAVIQQALLDPRDGRLPGYDPRHKPRQILNFLLEICRLDVDNPVLVEKGLVEILLPFTSTAGVGLWSITYKFLSSAVLVFLVGSNEEYARLFQGETSVTNLTIAACASVLEQHASRDHKVLVLWVSMCAKMALNDDLKPVLGPCCGFLNEIFIFYVQKDLLLSSLSLSALLHLSFNHERKQDILKRGEDMKKAILLAEENVDLELLASNLRRVLFRGDVEDVVEKKKKRKSLSGMFGKKKGEEDAGIQVMVGQVLLCSPYWLKVNRSRVDTIQYQPMPLCIYQTPTPTEIPTDLLKSPSSTSLNK